MDFCDGDYLQRHPVFKRNKHALQIILYTGDLEIVNPLGTHTRKHKVTVFYFTLGNIPPEDRSKLSNIYLLAVAKAQHVKRHGMQKLLDDLIGTLNDLSNGGIAFTVNGQERLFEGGLVAVTADTSAANLLGGFKEGVGFAKIPCRLCFVTSTELPKETNDK